jgi:hypothetical protein
MTIACMNPATTVGRHALSTRSWHRVADSRGVQSRSPPPLAMGGRKRRTTCCWELGMDSGVGGRGPLLSVCVSWRSVRLSTFSCRLANHRRANICRTGNVLLRKNEICTILGPAGRQGGRHWRPTSTSLASLTDRKQGWQSDENPSASYKRAVQGGVGELGRSVYSSSSQACKYFSSSPQ